MTVERARLLERVKAKVQGVEPKATIILFGSRARGEAGPHSDWDFLILVDGSLDARRKRRLRHALYELEWDTGEVMTSIIKTRQEWDEPKVIVSPFYRNVSHEGLTL